MSEAASGFDEEREIGRDGLNVVVDVAPFPVLGVDRFGRIVMFNAAAERLFGYARAELLGERLERLLPSEYGRLHGTGSARTIVGLRNDGSEIPIEVALKPIATRDGAFTLVSIVDLAENRRAEVHLRAIVDSSPNALVVVDGGGNVTLVNTQTERLFGYRPDELFGQPVEKLVPQRFLNMHMHQRAQFSSASTDRAMGAGRDIFGLTKDGREIPIEIALSSFELAHERFVLAAIIDNTERKRAEKLRVRSAELGDLALASADVALLKQEAVELVASSTGAQFVRVGELDATRNRLTFTAGLGWPADLLEHHTIDVAESSQALECLRTGRPICIERIESAQPFGPSQESRDVGIVASAVIPIRGKDAFVGILHVGVREERRFSEDDVAFMVGIGTIIGMAIDRDQRDRRITALNLELRHRYDELESFSYSVAHDLRAPLRAVSGFASALEEDHSEDLDDEARRFIGLIVGGAAQMGGLIDALLRLARLSRQEISHVKIDLSAMAAAIVGELRASEPDREIVATVAPGIVVEGDPALLRNVLANLLGNAWKFTRGRDPAHVRFELRTVANEAAYAVSDNGIGFTTERPDDLFAPFKRLHGKSYEGLGIGLATVSRIVHRHGGRVWAESQLESGSTFYFTLGDVR